MRQTKIILFLLIPLFVFSILGFLGNLHHYFELMSHFRLQYFVLALIISIALSWLRSWRWLGLGVICLLLNGSLLFNWYLPYSHKTEEAHDLRVLFSNINSQNDNYHTLLELIDLEEPDLVILQETSPSLLEAILPSLDSYPYTQSEARYDNFGISIFSRIPFEQVEITTWNGLLELPSIFAKLKIEETVVSLYSTHPFPPLNEGASVFRNQHLANIAQIVQKDKNPKILIGDLNTTMWSPNYDNLIKTAGLQNARKGFGILPTWPTFLPYMMIPMDHCLLSDDFMVTDIRTGAPIGSDHLPLIVDIMLKKKKRA